MSFEVPSLQVFGSKGGGEGTGHPMHALVPGSDTQCSAVKALVQYCTRGWTLSASTPALLHFCTISLLLAGFVELKSETCTFLQLHIFHRLAILLRYNLCNFHKLQVQKCISMHLNATSHLQQHASQCSSALCPPLWCALLDLIKRKIG